jgi:hypothetical protein
VKRHQPAKLVRISEHHICGISRERLVNLCFRPGALTDFPPSVSQEKQDK